MPTTTRDLKRKQDKLQTSATEAASLARAERVLADQQHSVAHNLELLAEDLRVRFEIIRHDFLMLRAVA